MTPAEIKKTRLYRTLAPCVRKEDREELARMLAMVPGSAVRWWQDGFEARALFIAFMWGDTPQGGAYWQELDERLCAAGHYD